MLLQVPELHGVPAAHSFISVKDMFYHESEYKNIIVQNIIKYSTYIDKAPVPLNRKESYDCVIISSVIRLRMQIMYNVFQRVYAFLICISGPKK